MNQEQIAALRLLADFAIERVGELGQDALPLEGVHLYHVGMAAKYVLHEVVSQPPDLGEVLMECSGWAFETFKPHSAEGVMAHLREEWQEFMADPTNGEEGADVMMLMHHWFLLKGIDIKWELVRKLAINRARIWGQRDERGVVKHISEVSTEDNHEFRTE